MSADAKIGRAPEAEDGWAGWDGIHDGPITPDCIDHQAVSLPDCIKAIEACLGQPLRWEFGGTPDAPILKGYLA